MNRPNVLRTPVSSLPPLPTSSVLAARVTTDHTWLISVFVTGCVHICRDEFSLAVAAHKLGVLHYNLASQQNRLHPTRLTTALIEVVVHAVRVICQMNCPLIIGIENDNICVRTYRQRSLSRIDTVDFCRLSGNNIYKFLAGQLSRAYTLGPHHMQSIAGAGGTVWNLSKIIPAGLLELCHIYTAVVG